MVRDDGLEPPILGRGSRIIPNDAENIDLSTFYIKLNSTE
jgi:hypothetical protein